MKRKIKLNGFSKYTVDKIGSVILSETEENAPFNEKTESYQLIDDNGQEQTVTFDEIQKLKQYSRYKLLNETQKGILTCKTMYANEKSYRLYLSGLSSIQIAMEMGRTPSTTARDIWRYKTNRLSLDKK